MISVSKAGSCKTATFLEIFLNMFLSISKMFAHSLFPIGFKTMLSCQKVAQMRVNPRFLTLSDMALRGSHSCKTHRADIQSTVFNNCQVYRHHRGKGTAGCVRTYLAVRALRRLPAASYPNWRKLNLRAILLACGG